MKAKDNIIKNMEINSEDMISFQKDLEQFHISLNDKQLKQFIEYYELLIEWNSFMNLTAITQFNDVLKKHFLDSLSIVNAVSDLSERSDTLIDVGTGAGFPGIPVKIAFPDLEITLLDSLNKRVQFLKEVVNRLDLENVTVIHGRAEDYARSDKLRESFNLCVSRAVANLATLSEYCLPFVRLGGYFISYKSEKISEEFDSAGEAIKILGGSFEKKAEFYLPNTDIYRNLFVIRKEKNTPGKFPRKAGIPSKEPIIK